MRIQTFNKSQVAMQPINEIFHIEYGNQFDFSKMECTDDPSAINFISRGSTNNGFVSKVHRYKDTEPYPAGLITVTMGGSYLLASFVQPAPFYTAQNIKVLKPKYDMTLAEKLFYCAAIQHNRFRYHSHSREANSTFDTIIVPSPNEIPENYKDIQFSSFDLSPLNVSKIDINIYHWHDFRLGDLFNIVKGKRLTKEQMLPGEIPFIGATDGNNGITSYIGNSENIHPGNLITVSYNGSIGYSFYQPVPFVASDDINILYPLFKLNKFIAMFLCTIISKERYRFNYGRKWDKSSMIESIIKLPALNNYPDWEWMELFIKSRAYSKLL